MKKLNNFIHEKLKLTSSTETYLFKPQTKDELKAAIKTIISEDGEDADLNSIDTSKITNMNDLFINYDFKGDVSNWDVSNVVTMKNMFSWCKNFNSDISRWNVSNVEHMDGMLTGCAKFNQDLSKWNVNKVIKYEPEKIFDFTRIKRDKSKWPKQGIH